MLSDGRPDGAVGGGVAGGVAEDDEAEPGNPCPLCLVNEDDAGSGGACFACGQMYCGECNTLETMGNLELCPACRAPFSVSAEDNFTRLWSLLHDRAPGHHTPSAQCNLGTVYARGTGVGQDHAEAARWYRKSAEQGNAQAQYNLGLSCHDGTGVGQDRAAAARWYRMAAEQGYDNAQYNLGVMYAHGRGVLQDHAEAAVWYRKAAEQGHQEAQFNLAILCRTGTGVGQDPAEAAAWCRKAAEQGYAAAQHNLGLMHFQGHGVPRDLRQAAEWWRKAAAQGDAGASNNLEAIRQCALGTPGMPVVVTGLAASPQFNGRAGLVQGPASRPGRLAVLLDGDTTPMSLREANLRKADGGAAARTPAAPAVPAVPGGTPSDDRADGAAGGGGGGVVAVDDVAEPENPCPLCLANEDNSGKYGSCHACGQMFCGDCDASAALVRGLCPTCRAPFDVSDEEDFTRLWSLTHDRSPGRHTAEAQCNLGTMYEHGTGVVQDHVAAVRWYRKAAEQGLARAHFNLGAAHGLGTGVTQDDVEAVRWYRKAAEQGHEQAQYNLAHRYKDGVGVGQDPAAAVRWYREAAEQGHEQTVQFHGPQWGFNSIPFGSPQVRPICMGRAYVRGA